MHDVHAAHAHLGVSHPSSSSARSLRTCIPAVTVSRMLCMLRMLPTEPQRKQVAYPRIACVDAFLTRPFRLAGLQT